MSKGILLRFERDSANLTHIARHGVLPSEVHEVFNGDTLELDAYAVDDEERFEELGTTNSGRILFVVTTVRNNFLRVVTAFDANRNQKLQLLAYYRRKYE